MAAYYTVSILLPGVTLLLAISQAGASGHRVSAIASEDMLI
jgi:hypothetical protein